MAVKWLDPGGDATYDTKLTTNAGGGTPAVATDFVHTGHVKSYNSTLGYQYKSSVVADAGGRFSVYVLFHAWPSATIRFMGIEQTGDGSGVAAVGITSAGVLQGIKDSGMVQWGSNGSTLSLDTWYRICFAWKLTSTTVNELRVFLNGNATPDITATNATLNRVTSADAIFGDIGANASFSPRFSDIYIDDSNALTDTGDIWVTAKRPNANGTTNGFTTGIGADPGSPYGSGHAVRENERPLSTTNGWSMVGAGSAITEEYSIENAATGDISLTGATIVDFMGWVYAKTLNAETASIIVANATSNISLTTTITMFVKVAGSTTYPAGNTDIGIITTTALTTVSLYECGIIVAYTPAVATSNVMGYMTANTKFWGT